MTGRAAMDYDPFEYIRSAYQVPARKGARVRYTGEGMSKAGTITSCAGAHFNITFDGEEETGPYHPTWEIEYLDQAHTQSKEEPNRG